MRLRELERAINCTLSEKPLPPESVIAACDCLSKKILAGALSYKTGAGGLGGAGLYVRAGLSGMNMESALGEAASMISRPVLEKRLAVELGAGGRLPLGVLFHIGPGNMDGQSAYSVIEGLLAGNINLLKLPSAENGISLFILKELIRIEPALKPYIYIFQIPSDDHSKIKKLAELSDGIVTWGGEAAIRAMRTLAPCGSKLIEWGPKASFAYITRLGMTEESLAGLALHLLQTQKRLCSSCQMIFLEGEKSEELTAFCERFGEIMERTEVRRREALLYHSDFAQLASTAQETLYQYTAGLERLAGFVPPDNPYDRAAGDTDTGIYVKGYRVELLSRDKIMERLRKKGHCLQTVGLLCGEEERNELSHLFLRAGAVRIRDGAGMSVLSEGEPHDGEYPLQRYTKAVSVSAEGNPAIWGNGGLRG